MKKNRMLRTASVLLILVLLTTSIIGGTFAKYTTTGSGSDTARVAKWGVKITMSDDDAIFSSTYEKATSSTELTATNSVVAATNADSSQDKVVAPGTTGSTTFSITGTPEVALNLTVEMTVTHTVKVAKDQDYTMAAGMFADTPVKVKLTEDYEPIHFKLEKETATAGTYEVVKLDTDHTVKDGGSISAENLTLAELKTVLESLSTVYEANTTLDATYKITWDWDFETSFTSYTNTDGYTAYSNANILDTYLGNEATAQQEAYTIKITATQIN